jgi:hypothetical protein
LIERTYSSRAPAFARRFSSLDELLLASAQRLLRMRAGMLFSDTRRQENQLEKRISRPTEFSLV